MDWGDESVSEGVVERPFEHHGSGRRVPGLLWLPPGAEGPRPLVAMSHGAAGSKRESFVVSLARHMVRQRGFAVVAIDGPVHGDRRADPGAPPFLVLLEFSQRWASDPVMTDQLIADWSATLDMVQALEVVGDGPVGWWGLSMGTIVGLPLVASDRRITAAVLGLMGLTGPTRERIAADAPNVRCPVLFLSQWDDELFPHDTSAELFGLIGSPDKRWHLHVGRHGQVPAEAFAAGEQFLHRHLAGDD